MYSASNFVLSGIPVTVAASQTDSPITSGVRLAADDRMGVSFWLTVSAATGTIEVDAQHSPDGTTWSAVNTTDARVVVTASGTSKLFINSLNTNSKSYLPLFPWVRLVATTVGGESLTVSAVYVTTCSQ